ncbi:PrnB family protein [Parvularcula marina]|uniref:DUF1864 family protein n=1 Tax=Parvularcula marina TaxID=2292771 RepID=A0A371REP4_9PROT|nr:monodechloroaminopyrrolnitrin synthase PrnB family protein [Parvularcula marina]RFB03914.1 DUF1864 family protein [Parvularcula marina]
MTDTSHGIPTAKYGASAARFDHWIRTDFVELNTQLEELYFAQSDKANVAGVGDDLKDALRRGGHEHIVALWREGNTDDGFDSAFGVLGNVGLYMGALRRHELTNPDTEDRSPFPEASSLALHIGATIGMAPRFATAHLATHNYAVNGVRKSYTSLKDEFLFIDENTRGILALTEAAEALARIVPLGVSNMVALDLFESAAKSLERAIKINQGLFDNLDRDRFFYCVRPYYKPYRVGREVYRGANAGDFAGINQLDLLLGLTRASDPYYAQLLVDKLLFMTPGDQAKLKDTMRYPSLLDSLLGLAGHAEADWFKRAGAAYLKVADLFAETARQHHDNLVKKFIVGPSDDLGDQHLQQVTASGPPLPVLIRALEKLRDFRTAAKRDDIETRADDIAKLRELVS